MMRVLVTGGAGAIGSCLVDGLLARGDRVGVVDSFHPFYPRARKLRNLAAARAHPGFSGLYEGDVRDRAFLARAFAELRPELVAHFAARAGVRPSVSEPFEYADVNVAGTAAVAECALEAGAERLVFASSSTVYGVRPEGPFVEEDDASPPLSPYGATKRAAELLLHSLHLTRKLHVTCLRFFSVYGPRQRPDLALATFARLMRQDEPIPLYGDGSYARDFTYVDDVVEGCLRAIDLCEGHRVYNLGRGRPHTMSQAIAELERALGRRAVRDLRPAHPADTPHTWASIERARAELGYEPAIELAEGIRRYTTWLDQEAAA